MGRTQRQRKRNSSTKVAVVENDPTIINLKRRLKLKKYLLPCLKVADFQSSGRGFICNQPIKASTTLLRIPLKAMITFDTLVNSDIKECLLPNSKFSFQTLLSVFLVFEKHKVKSDWTFYFDTIPKESPPLPCFTCDNEIDCLPNDLKRLVCTSKEKFTQMWLQIVNCINSRWFCSCCSRSAKSIFNLSDFSWGYSMVNTRAVYVDPKIFKKPNEWVDFILDEPSMALCPLLDMFNHSFEAKTDAKLVEYKGEWFFQLTTLTNHKKYEQVFISYGSHNNEVLLHEYGFFILGNPLDCVKFTLEDTLFVTNINLSAAQQNFIRSKDLTNNLYISSMGLSFNLKALLYIFFQKNTQKWSSNIFSENYELEIEMKINHVAKILLNQKARKYLLKSNLDKAQSNEYQVLINYVKYFKTLCEGLANTI